MGRLLSLKEKEFLSKTGKRHWRRCRMWAEILGISAQEANRNWSLVIKPAIGDVTWVTSAPPSAVVVSVKAAMVEFLLRNAKRDRDTAERTQAAQSEQLERLNRVNKRYSYSRNRTAAAHGEDIPDAEGRLKIMLWAIRKCGDEQRAAKAFDRALVVRGQLDE